MTPILGIGSTGGGSVTRGSRRVSVPSRGRPPGGRRSAGADRQKRRGIEEGRARDAELPKGASDYRPGLLVGARSLQRSKATRMTKAPRSAARLATGSGTPRSRSAAMAVPIDG
jgi:hypothetical protein